MKMNLKIKSFILIAFILGFGTSFLCKDNVNGFVFYGTDLEFVCYGRYDNNGELVIITATNPNKSTTNIGLCEASNLIIEHSYKILDKFCYDSLQVDSILFFSPIPLEKEDSIEVDEL